MLNRVHLFTPVVGPWSGGSVTRSGCRSYLSAPNTVRCYYGQECKATEMLFGTRTRRETSLRDLRTFVQSNRFEFQNSLLFTVLGVGQRSQFPIIPETSGGCVESSVARRHFQKKFTVKFTDKFTVPPTSVNCASFWPRPLLSPIHLGDLRLASTLPSSRSVFVYSSDSAPAQVPVLYAQCRRS